ncbi:MAG: acyltransferase [Thermosipho sp. (in: thermotogales)]|nr:acyltransferase [Thermosipho sp. (in: thermotogales)]
MRIREIDVSKGILILMVVFAHSYVPYSVMIYISYILSAFMFISGYLFKNEEFFVKLKKVLLNLWIPFVFLSFVGFTIYYFVNKLVQYDDKVFEKFFDFIIFGYTHLNMPVTAVPLWYLYMFAVAEIVFLIFLKMRMIHFIPILSFLSTIFIQNQSRFFKLDVAFHGLIWFYLGYLLRKKGFNYKFKKPFLIFLIFSIFLVLIVAFNGMDDWRDNNYGNLPLLSYLGELAYIFIVISLSNMIKSERIKRFFELFGRYTIFVLGYHIVLPGLLAPLLNDPIQFLEKFWWLYYIVDVSILYVFLCFVPKNIIFFLSGQFHLIKKRKSLPA